MKIKWFLFGFIFLLVTCGCGKQSIDKTSNQSGNVELIVSVASSLTESMKEIVHLFETEHPNIQLTLNIAGSGTLQQQIEQGAPVDLFLSAGMSQMDTLLNKDLIDPMHHTILLTNELVVITSTDAQHQPFRLEDLLKEDYSVIAIGDPLVAPVGDYAKQALTYYQLWEKLNSKVVLAQNTRQVLTYVETGNADAGIVYQTDALASNKVDVALVIEPQSYGRIQYPVGIVTQSEHKEEAKIFFSFLQSESAQQIFHRYGFYNPNQ